MPLVVLHVLNGDATYAALKPLQLQGRALVWRDALLEGPARNGLRSLEDWTHRARHLAPMGIDPGQYLEGVRAFLKDFAAAARGEETVLWFEEDLFCQLPLCYLLSMKAAAGAWSVVCPEDPLGPSKPDRLAVLYDERRPADPALVDLATRAWDAYASADPTRVEALLSEDLARWPLLRRGLLAHLSRFPGVANGLGAHEAALLAILREAGGPLPFRELFPRFNDGPLGRVLGAGDHVAAWWLWSLQDGARPLVRIEGLRAGDFARQTQAAIREWRIELTKAGDDAMDGRADHVKLNAPERWLGGVHVKPRENAWRWDPENERLVAPTG